MPSVSLQFLERVSRPLLARLLAPHGEALSAHGFAVAPLAASAQLDRASVHALWALLSSSSSELAPVGDSLAPVSDVATRAGHELLLRHDAARALDRELSAEDCAALAYLDHRALFDMARPQAGSASPRAFASFQSSTPRPIADDAAGDASFARLMSAALDARGRTRHFRVHAHRAATERHFELVYGRLAAARDLLGKSADGASHEVTAQVTDRTTERAHAVFHDDTLRLEVAGPDWTKELVRRCFGEAYFGSAAHFAGDETITLAPLADLVAALSADGVPGLKSVELQQVGVDLPGGWVAIGARNDCTRGATGGYVLRALSDGTPTEATFLLTTTTSSRPVTVKIAVPRKLEFNRKNPRVVGIVRDWLVARGFMAIPDHLRASAAPVATATDA